MQKIRLAHPADKSAITSKNCRLQWEPQQQTLPDEKLIYTLVVFATRPSLRNLPRPSRRTSRSRSRRRRRSKPLPLFTTRALTRNFFDLPIRAKGLKAGRTYWWQVRAHGSEGQVVAMSERRSFKVKKSLEPVSEILMERRTPLASAYAIHETTAAAEELWWLSPENLMPCPPVLWGKPVKLRRRGETDSSPAEPGTTPGGSTDPLSLVWGNEAAEVYLPPYLVQHGSVLWDLSHIPGCERVLLQVSGEDGFAEPNDGNVMEDPNVINYYWGPPQLTCGFEEIETPSGPPPSGSLISSGDIDLFNSRHGGASILPSDLHPDIIRQIRTIPCNESREQIDLASDPVTIHCVRNPVIEIGAQVTRWTWGPNPGREINFSLLFEEPFPNVRTMRLDEETGAMVPVSAPSTLLIYTHAVPSMLDRSSCDNISLTMDGEPVDRRNNISLLSGGNAYDVYVIPLSEWPRGRGYDFRLVQEWRGGILPNTLWDFLDGRVSAVVIPGISPSWHYCGGIAHGYDSLYGREDLPDEPTRSPYYYYTARTGHCLPSGLANTWCEVAQGIPQYNDFMESTFRGTRRVTHDFAGGSAVDVWLDEPVGEQEVTVRFETDGSGDFRYILPITTEPVMMRETRDSGELLWKVDCMDGVGAQIRTTNRRPNIVYGGRPSFPTGRSQFDPPRMQVWLSVRIASNGRGGYVWADIHYDLTAV